MAAQFGRTNVIRVLVELGADINTPNNTGVSPINIAHKRGYIDVVMLLVNSGADVKQHLMDLNLWNG